MAVAMTALLPLSAAPGVELEAGKLYPGGTRLEVAELGVAFTVPEGWRGAWPQGSEVFVLQPESDPQTTILAIGEEGSRAEVTATMAAPIDLGDGVSLVPSSAVGERGSALTGRYQVKGAQAPLVAYAEALVGPSEIAVAYILISAQGSIAAYEPAVRALVDGTRLGAPAAGADAPSSTGAATGGSSGSGDRWDNYLKGKYIVRYYTRTGYTDEEHLWLCSDGSFQRRGAAGGFGGGASGAFQSDGAGRWTATGAGEHGTLTLHYGDGSTATYQLRWDYQENHLYVDGKRWLHGTNEVCS